MRSESAAAESTRGLVEAAREAERQGRWFDAAAAHASLAQAAPNEPEHRLRLGLALARANRLDAAAGALLVAARAFAAKGEIEKAVACALVAKTHRPDDRRLDEALEVWRAKRILRPVGETTTKDAAFVEPADWSESAEFRELRAAANDDAPDGELIDDDTFERLYAGFSSSWQCDSR